jgi:hypothetical protein
MDTRTVDLIASDSACCVSAASFGITSLRRRPGPVDFYDVNLDPGLRRDDDQNPGLA